MQARQQSPFCVQLQTRPKMQSEIQAATGDAFLHSNELDIGQHVVILHICWCEGASSYISAEAANEWVCVWVIVEDQQIFFLVNIFFILVSKTLVPILIWHVVIIITLSLLWKSGHLRLVVDQYSSKAPAQYTQHATPSLFNLDIAIIKLIIVKTFLGHSYHSILLSCV